MAYHFWHAGRGSALADIQDWFWAVRPVPLQGKKEVDPNEKKTIAEAPKLVAIRVEKCEEHEEIRGTIKQLFEKKSHHGIIARIEGRLILPGNSSIQYVLPTPFVLAIAGDPMGRKVTTTTTLPFQKFPFVFDITNFKLPPSINGTRLSLTYQINVLMRLNKGFKQLGSLAIQLRGNHKISSVPIASKEKKEVATRESLVLAEGGAIILELPSVQFLLQDDIPFEIIATDLNKSLRIKKIHVFLVQKISWTEVKANQQKIRIEESILEVVTFKRFLKREEFRRKGKFEGGKVLQCTSYYGPDVDEKVVPKIPFITKVEYEIQVRLLLSEQTMDMKGIPITVGIEYDGPIPSAPVAGSAPPEEEDGNNHQGLIPTPSAPMQNLLAASRNSLMFPILLGPPPSYSTLSSRATSYETLPPNYEDLPKILDDDLDIEFEQDNLDALSIEGN